MIRFTFGSPDSLRQRREDAQHACQSLGDTIVTLKFDGSNPASVAAAIRQMEAAVDSKFAAYRGNDLVADVARTMKESYRKVILERASDGAASNTLILRGGAALKSHASTNIGSAACDGSDDDETLTSASNWNTSAVAAFGVGALGIAFQWNYWHRAPVLPSMLVLYFMAFGAFQIGLVSEALAQGYIRESGGWTAQLLPIRPTGGIFRRDEAPALFWYELLVRVVLGLGSILVPVWVPFYRHFLH
ncbi:MAG TPA: hypothetical protein VHY19_02170 [Steroidobacteraceae bacterium]|jgi:hypothetical protein|nr:hypothetical protein [Steroidobacteraceae bacterium]